MVMVMVCATASGILTVTAILMVSGTWVVYEVDCKLPQFSGAFPFNPGDNKKIVPANSMSRIRGRIWINPALVLDDFRTMYL